MHDHQFSTIIGEIALSSVAHSWWHAAAAASAAQLLGRIARAHSASSTDLPEALLHTSSFSSMASDVAASECVTTHVFAATSVSTLSTPARHRNRNKQRAGAGAVFP